MYMIDRLLEQSSHLLRRNLTPASTRKRRVIDGAQLSTF
jgi:hypothetical protein